MSLINLSFIIKYLFVTLSFVIKYAFITLFFIFFNIKL